MQTGSLAQRVSVLEHSVNDQGGIMQRLEGLSADLKHLRVQVGELRLDTAALRGDLTTAIEQTNVHMRVLHEEVLERLQNLR